MAAHRCPFLITVFAAGIVAFPLGCQQGVPGVTRSEWEQHESARDEVLVTLVKDVQDLRARLVALQEAKATPTAAKERRRK